MLFCPMKTRIEQKHRREGGEEEEREWARERLKERCRVLSPCYQDQRDARSQTYEKAIVREHFAPVTSARQWPPLTRPVTVSLFVDNAWKYAETRRAACGLSLVCRFAVSSYSRSLRGIGKKTCIAFSSKSSSFSEIAPSSGILYLILSYSCFLRI